LKSLALHPEYHLYERKRQVYCSSLQVADEFRKRHDHVLRDIENLDCSEGFRLPNDGESSYSNEQNKRQPMYYMTKDGSKLYIKSL
jgi:Rha family phage regulatory protein